MIIIVVQRKTAGSVETLICGVRTFVLISIVCVKQQISLKLDSAVRWRKLWRHSEKRSGECSVVGAGAITHCGSRFYTCNGFSQLAC